MSNRPVTPSALRRCEQCDKRFVFTVLVGLTVETGVVCSELCALRYEGKPTGIIDQAGMRAYGTRVEREAWDTSTPVLDLMEARPCPI